MNNYIVCHYGEIGLKGKNRRYFEEQLMRNIECALPANSFEQIKRISGRIIVKLNQSARQKEHAIKEALANIFGVVYFAFSEECESAVKKIEEKAFKLLDRKEFDTFRVTSKRSRKDFSLTSQQISEIVGSYIVEKLNKKVDLKYPDLTCFIELVDKRTFLYTEKIRGAGGLPVGTGGKVVVMLSGGIDSPVAAFFAAKRGLELVFVHFHAYPYTNAASIDKTKKLAGMFCKYQCKVKLHLIPFGEIQKEVVLNAPAKLRVVLYRRFMLRIARELAVKEKALAIATGESLGQVASQTLQNIGVIQKAVDMPIIRPLIGLDKEEIIRKAREIGSLDISILPDQDCCSRFIPKHPETRADINEVSSAEINIRNAETLIKNSIEQADVVVFD